VRRKPFVPALSEIGEQVHREVLQPTVFNARAVRGPFVEAGREGARWSTRCRREIRDMGRKHLRNPPDRRLDALLTGAQHQIGLRGRLVRRVHPCEARKLARARTRVKALGSSAENRGVRDRIRVAVPLS